MSRLDSFRWTEGGELYFSGDIWKLAEFMHINYLELAKEVGWKVQEKTACDFADLPKENKRVMLELAYRIIKEVLS